MKVFGGKPSPPTLSQSLEQKARNRSRVSIASRNIHSGMMNMKCKRRCKLMTSLLAEHNKKGECMHTGHWSVKSNQQEFCFLKKNFVFWKRIFGRFRRNDRPRSILSRANQREFWLISSDGATCIMNRFQSRAKKTKNISDERWMNCRRWVIAEKKSNKQRHLSLRTNFWLLLLSTSQKLKLSKAHRLIAVHISRINHFLISFVRIASFSKFVGHCFLNSWWLPNSTSTLW